MRRIRVLVVDDAVVVRRLVTDALSGDPELDVVATAPNGRIALQKIPQCNPDVVTLDIEMPEMDGLEALREIRKSHPALPVIMFSTLTERGASATLDALALGASDYVTKPSNLRGLDESLAQVREQLGTKIRWLCRGAASTGPSAPPVPSARPPGAVPPTPAAGSTGHAGIEIVAIGVSTGGPNALAEVMPALPGDLPVPVVIVQHMPPTFTGLLAGRLDSQSRLHVAEGRADDVLRPGHAYIAPGGYHMTVRRHGLDVRLALNEDPPENSCRPAVDVLFRSVAALYGRSALGIVLTGMGSDGFRGAEAIRQAGGRVFAQDQATSIVWGMPKFVVEAGLAEKVLPLDAVAPEIVSAVARRPSLPGGLARRGR